jgi:hypothetical protein
MKTKSISIRIEDKDFEKWNKAAREYKNLSAFFLSMIGDAFKYRALIEQVKIIEAMRIKKDVIMEYAKKVEWQEKQGRLNRGK